MLINKEKVQQLSDMLKQNKTDALVILSRNHSDKTLGIFLEIEVKNQTAFIFEQNGEVTVVCENDNKSTYAGLSTIVEDDDIYCKVAETLNEKQIKTIALNISETDYLADGLTMGQYLGLEEAIGKETFKSMVTSSEEIVGDLRALKSETEIGKIKKAVDITVAIYKEVHKQVKIGMSETQIGDLFVNGMKKYGVVNALGSHDYAYPLVMINRCGLSHREPMDKFILQEGDILVCDFSVRYEGYCSDIARGFYALKQNEKQPPKDVQHAFDTAVNAVSNVLSNIKVGMRGCDVDWLGRKIIEEGGYPTIRHSCGHQLGRSVHDGGTPLSPYNENKPQTTDTVRSNEVYAIEPTVIQDNGLPSFIVEEDIVLREEGIEVLSERQMELWLIGE